MINTRNAIEGITTDARGHQKDNKLLWTTHLYETEQSLKEKSAKPSTRRNRPISNKEIDSIK